MNPSTSSRSPCPVSPARRQSGIALIMALIMLVVATIAALAGIRGITVQEKLAANLFDRAIAMQAAEFAMARAEKWLYETERSAILSSGAVVNCTATHDCQSLPASTFTPDQAAWTSVGLGSFNQAYHAGSDPQYHIQYLGLKNSDANTDTSQSINSLQYGATGGGSNALNAMQNAVYLVTARSSRPDSDGDRAVVVLSALIKSN